MKLICINKKDSQFALRVFFIFAPGKNILIKSDIFFNTLINIEEKYFFHVSDSVYKMIYKYAKIKDIIPQPAANFINFIRSISKPRKSYAADSAYRIVISPEEAEEFLVEYHIEKSALDRVIKKSYTLLNLISFFTVLNEEVRAWTIREGSPALEAAGAVHTDMKKGFIRAEVVSSRHLQEYGSFQEAKKVGQVRLEGKEYRVQDGDIINFRFNI